MRTEKNSIEYNFLCVPLLAFKGLSVLGVLLEDGRIWGNGSTGNSIESFILLTVVVVIRIVFFVTVSPFKQHAQQTMFCLLYKFFSLTYSFAHFNAPPNLFHFLGELFFILNNSAFEPLYTREKSCFFID